VIFFAQAVEPGLALGPDVATLTPRALISTIVVVGLMALAAWVLRRRTGVGRFKQQRVAIETAVSLGERRSLVIVSVEGRRLLLGVAPGHIGLVTELGADSSFGQALDSSLAKGGTP
jgi:flagellar biosynthetic protein FliO